MKRLLGCGAWATAVLMAGCIWFPRQTYTQAQLNAIETREVDASFDETFTAASNALFDAGYIVSMSDREAGLLTGTRSIDRSRRRRWSKDPTIEDIDYAMSIMIRETGRARCAVRVKTSVNGVQRVDENAIDQIWVLMQRQVLMTAPLAAESPY